jgi:hypothetical protein
MFYQLRPCYRYGLLVIFLLATAFLASLFFVQKNRHAAREIYQDLTRYGLTYDIDACSVDPAFKKIPQGIKGEEDCIATIAQLIKKKEPLPLLLVAFPFKSPNHAKKTIGALPDMAERKSLEYLQSLLDEIRNVYSPGARLTIFCDGIAFASLFGLSYADILKYETALQALVTDLPDIKLYTSKDLGDEALTKFETFSGKAPQEPAPLNETTRKRLEHEFDYPQGKAFLVSKSLNIDALGTLFAHRETALRNFVSVAFPSNRFMRLTAHFTPDISKKFGIRLSSHSCVLPYHGALAEDLDGSWTIRFVSEIPLDRYYLTSKEIHGITCHYFKQH